MKRRYEKLAITTRPELVNYATYPAVNWFSFYSLQSVLKEYGYTSFDKFDVGTLDKNGFAKKMILGSIANFQPLRFIAHVATPGTFIIAIKN